MERNLLSNLDAKPNFENEEIKLKIQKHKIV